FLKSIKLSKKSIEMNLFYQPKNLAGENKNTRAESTGLVNKKNAGSPFRINSEWIVSITIPNLIHKNRCE
ncbi:MAG: hypothetical protein K9M01_04550, partial [Candidatus Omnitrophica bacterium]|nr:hypothetical protein [Candidatus Omnitrophota bacterium]MCF7887686.1 hypothetical protein [Candidatus Omnitrophota bacterium]